MRTRSPRGIIFVLIGSVCWGFSATCIQLIVSGWGLSTEWVSAIRLIVAGPLFLVTAGALHGPQIPALLKDRPNLITILVFGLIGILLTQIAYFYCTSYTNAGTSTTLERLALILILGWSCLVARRLPHPSEIIGVVLALIGVFMIATQGNPGTIVLPIVGLLWGLGDAAGTACYMIMPTRPLQTYHPLVVTGVGMTFAGVVALVVFRPWAIAVDVDVTPRVIWIMVLLVLIGTLGAYAFYLQGIKECGSVVAGMMSCLVPVSAIVISALWLKTPVSVWDIVGCALILAMVVIVTRTTNAE